jgi:hypothetical protein
MKNIVILFVISFIFLYGFRAFSQDLPYQKGIEPVSLTPDELFVLSNIPELVVPELYKGMNAPLLPISVDNSTQPYFRAITWQSGYECGQSSGIAFGFTYEIDRERGLSASQGVNLYPTHFTWDFLNNANNYQGASFFDSWEIVRACGNMNIVDYGGGLNTGGYTRWISGYDVYYNGMHNRLNSVKGIRVDTPEGLQTLKYWLADHLEGASVGGVANIYGQYFGTPSTTLPANTPMAGKYVQTYWGGSPSPLVSPAISVPPIVPSPLVSPAISVPPILPSPLLSPAISGAVILPSPLVSPAMDGTSVEPSPVWSPKTSVPSIFPSPSVSPVTSVPSIIPSPSVSPAISGVVTFPSPLISPAISGVVTFPSPLVSPAM